MDKIAAVLLEKANQKEIENVPRCLKVKTFVRQTSAPGERKASMIRPGPDLIGRCVAHFSRLEHNLHPGSNEEARKVALEVVFEARRDLDGIPGVALATVTGGNLLVTTSAHEELQKQKGKR